MGRIEELQAQVKALQLEIRTLKTNDIIIIDGAKIEKKHYHGGRKDEWIVSVEKLNHDINGHESTRYLGIVAEPTREEAAARLDYLIDSLTRLKGMI